MSRLNLGIIESTSKFKIPTYTTSERDALVPETGMMIYNSTEQRVQIYYEEWVGAGEKISTSGVEFAASGGNVTTINNYRVHTFITMDLSM